MGLTISQALNKRNPTRTPYEPVPSFIRVIWPNGAVRETNTAEEMEDVIQSAQWDFFWDRTHFRQVMASRALAWSLVEIDIDGSSTDFLQELERAQLIIVGFHYDNAERLTHNSNEVVMREDFHAPQVYLSEDVGVDPWIRQGATP